ELSDKRGGGGRGRRRTGHRRGTGRRHRRRVVQGRSSGLVRRSTSRIIENLNLGKLAIVDQCRGVRSLRGGTTTISRTSITSSSSISILLRLLLLHALILIVGTHQSNLIHRGNNTTLHRRQ